MVYICRPTRLNYLTNQWLTHTHLNTHKLVIVIRSATAELKKVKKMTDYKISLLDLQETRKPSTFTKLQMRVKSLRPHSREDILWIESIYAPPDNTTTYSAKRYPMVQNVLKQGVAKQSQGYKYSQLKGRAKATGKKPMLIKFKPC